jgi:peptidoglycan/LPS O-acetylase OafA/YrhL
MFAATLAMFIPIAVLAYFVSRSPARTNRSHWLATIRAALVLALD